MKHLKTLIHCGLLAVAMVAGTLTAAPLGTAFSYQGRLDQNGLPAPNGIYQMNFALFVDAMGGNPLFTYNEASVPVTNGLFNTSLDFGATAFAGEERWLQISVRTNNNELPFTLLLPRTSLTPAPNARFASTAGTATNVGSGAVSASGLATVGVPASGQLLKYDGTQLAWQNPGWEMNGNTAVPGSFLGTVNNLPLELRANNTRALRLEPNATAANIIGGFAGNYAENGVVAGVLGGGGAASWASLPGANRVLDSASTLCGGISNSVGTANGNPNDAVYASLIGGYANSAEGQSSTIGGGAYNRATGMGSIVGGGWFGVASGPWSGIGGGFRNVASGNSATVAGGEENQATGSRASVAGGYQNLAPGEESFIGGGSRNSAAGIGAVALGGYENVAQGADSFAAGLKAIATHNNCFVWADYQTDPQQPLLPLAYESTAPNQFRVRASGGIFLEGHMSAKTVTITGGADLAEPFPMAGMIEKGAVVVIDHEHPGQLKQSTKAYDKRVAGIVSGANGVHPGIALMQEGRLDQGQNVALTGRVYVKADTAYGVIEPGDLLTTSDTPGHAMKVTDHAGAQGAILGKAMSALKEGTGLVLVLVTLQ